MVLTMAYNTQNYWDFGLSSRNQVQSSVIQGLVLPLHVSIFIDHHQRVISLFTSVPLMFPPPPHHLMTETDPVSESFCFLCSRIPGDGQSPKT
jgi:hypothetical protein